MTGWLARDPAILLLALFLAGAALFLLGLRAALMRAGPGRADVKSVSLRLDAANYQPGKLSGLLEPQTVEAMSGLRKQLMQAGFSGPNAPKYFALVKVLMAAFGVAAGIVLVLAVPALAQLEAMARLCIVVVLFVAAYFLPTMIVDRRRRRYIDGIAVALPDALDLMLVCVEAGQSIDHAVMRVARDMREIHPGLADRLRATTEALKAGADRGEAFARLAWETDNDDLRSFASVVQQSAAMGTPVAETFRVYAADLRDKRVRQVEERANMLPTKLTLGTMVFTVPPLLILLLTPPVFRILQIF